MMKAIQDAILDTIHEHETRLNGIVGAQLDHGEHCIGWCEGEKWPPFLIRISPLYPLLVRKRKFVLVVSDRRFFALELSTSWLGELGVKSMAASWALSDLRSVEPDTGILTSSVTLRARDGRKLRYTHMLRSAAAEFAAFVAQAKSARD